MVNLTEPDLEYGKEDATFQAAGGEPGIRALVDRFYDIMATDERYRDIWLMHTQPPEVARDKLARFLCAWTGGPRLYSQKYGPISIPKVHSHLPISSAHRDQWLSCMGDALATQNYPARFQRYLLEQLAIPASRVRDICARNLDAGES